MAEEPEHEVVEEEEMDVDGVGEGGEAAAAKKKKKKKKKKSAGAEGAGAEGGGEGGAEVGGQGGAAGGEENAAGGGENGENGAPAEMSAAKKKREKQKAAAARKKAAAAELASSGGVGVTGADCLWQTEMRGIKKWDVFPAPEKGGTPQTWPPSIPVSQMFPSGIFPEGELHEYEVGLLTPLYIYIYAPRPSYVYLRRFCFFVLRPLTQSITYATRPFFLYLSGYSVFCSPPTKRTFSHMSHTHLSYISPSSFSILRAIQTALGSPLPRCVSVSVCTTSRTRSCGRPPSAIGRGASTCRPRSSRGCS